MPLMKQKIAAPLPAALACGMLLDGNRALFLVKKDEKGNETLSLPCTLIYAGENPAGAAVGALGAQAGIDAQEQGVMMQARHNVGSRKRKTFVPVLVFKMGAKNTCIRLSGDFSGYKWLEEKEAARCKFSKECGWLITLLKR